MLMNNCGIEIRRVVEYSALFPNEKPLDVIKVLKTFNRLEVIRCATLVSLHYGNMPFPNPEKTLFSKISDKHMKYLNGCFEKYFQRIRLPQNGKVQLVTNRTGLELFRLILGIQPSEFKGTIKDEDKEFMLFKIITSLNEKIMSFQNGNNALKLDELTFLNSYLTNDLNNFVFKSCMSNQMLLFYKLTDFIPTNEVLTKAQAVLFDKWGIKSWKEYFGTLMYLANETNKYYVNSLHGFPIINVRKISEHCEEGLFSSSLVEEMSIGVDEYIPCEENENLRSLNADYRQFRAKPFIKISEDEYAAINIELVCERIYNSLYFDFQPLIKSKKDGVGFFDYNKDFVENELFRKSLWHCFHSSYITFPSKNVVSKHEDKNEPDFYARKFENILLFECKAIKMNGLIRDNGNYAKLLDDLHEKIVEKTRELDSTRRQFTGAPIPIGIGQLIHHIDSIEEDEFKWDDNIPDSVVYYPILVLEDARFMQPGLLSIVNRWFYEQLEKHNRLSVESINCRPVMVLSIPTLLFYDKFIKRRGLVNLIDAFLCKKSVQMPNGVYLVEPLADFDSYIRSFSHRKEDILNKYFKEWLERNL